MIARTLAIVSLTAAFTAATAPPASAQPRQRFAIAVNGMVQTTRNPFTDRLELEINRETASTDVRYPADGGPLGDASVAVRLWRNFGAGIGVSRFTRDERAATTSRIPHPFFFDSPREVEGDAPATRTERAVHAYAVLRFAPVRRLVVMVSAGSSFLTLEQDAVTSVEYDESFPYDTATFRRAPTRRASGSAVGMNAGADVAWMFTRHVGVGAAARIARATIDLELAPGRSKAIDAGGVSAGGGIRIAF